MAGEFGYQLVWVGMVGRTRSENLMAGFRPADAAALARDHYAASA